MPTDEPRFVKADSGNEYLDDGVALRPVKLVQFRERHRDPSVFELLDDAEFRAIHVLDAQRIDPDPNLERFSVPMRGELVNMSLCDDPSATAFDAIHILREVDAARQAWKAEKFNQFGRHCVSVGMFCERMRVRPLGPKALAWDAAQEKRSKGGKKREKLRPDEKTLACDLMRLAIDPPYVGKTQASVRVAGTLAAEHGINVSAKTVARVWDAAGQK